MRKRLSLKKREKWAFYGFISPWIIGFVFFTIGPIIASLYFSFTNYSIISSAKFIGFKNYSDLLKDSLFWVSLYNTVYYVVFFVPLGIIISFGLAMFLNQRVRGLAIYRTIYYLPAVMPAVANAVLWIWLLDPQWGIINTGLGMIGIQGPGWLASEQWSKPGIILMSLWSLGAWIIIYLAGLQGVPTQFYDAAEIDGATKLQKFFNITLPLMTPTIFFTSIIGLIGAFQIFTQAYIMTSGGPVDSTLFYAFYLYRSAFNYLKMGYASSMAWILFIIVLIFTVLQFKLSRKWVFYG